MLQSRRSINYCNSSADPKQITMKSVPAATVENGDSIPKEGEATY
jgi:hypothetical protein